MIFLSVEKATKKNLPEILQTSVNFRYFDNEGFEIIFKEDKTGFSKEYRRTTTINKRVAICFIEKD